jgi:hypothetical protein
MCIPEPKEAAPSQCERDRERSWSEAAALRSPKGIRSRRIKKQRSVNFVVRPKRVVLQRSDTLSHWKLSHQTSVFRSLATCYQRGFQMKGHKGGMSMSTPAEKAAAYLARLEADRRAALAVSEAKAEEAELIKARQKGFEEALEILGLQIPPDDTEAKPVTPSARQRRNIPLLIIRELSFSGTAMAKEQIARSIDYLPWQTERALRRLESSGKIVQNSDGRWEVVTSTVTQTNGHAIAAAN